MNGRFEVRNGEKKVVEIPGGGGNGGPGTQVSKYPDMKKKTCLYNIPGDSIRDLFIPKR